MPIVSPWIFYLIGMLPVLSCIFAIISLILVISSIVVVVSYVCPPYDEEEEKLYKRATKFIIPITVVCLIITILIPSQETAYTMLISSYITEDNVEIATDTIKDTVDYIFDKLDNEEQE